MPVGPHLIVGGFQVPVQVQQHDVVQIDHERARAGAQPGPGIGQLHAGQLGARAHIAGRQLLAGMHHALLDGILQPSLIGAHHHPLSLRGDPRNLAQETIGRLLPGIARDHVSRCQRLQLWRHL